MANLIFIAVRIALKELARNRMRSILTMLGVIIGVGAVISMVSLGQGASALVRSQIASLGANMILIFPGSATHGGVRAGAGTAQTLTVGDAEALEREARFIAAVTYSRRGVFQIVNGNQNWNTGVYGVTPEYVEVRDWGLESGAFFTKRDMDAASNVAVLGRTVADNLFYEGSQPIGQVVRIKNIPFRIIGVLSAKGQTSFGADQDDAALIPFTTAERKVLGAELAGRVGSIQVSALDEYSMPEAANEIRQILRARHRIPPSEEDDFTVRSLDDIVKSAEATTRVLAMLLLAIASISLLVGGVGIMNIMLVSVSERTGEIGIRMAVGAKRRDILLQFLTEALVMSLAGGFVGILAGIASSKILSASAGWPVLISPQSVLLSFAFAAVVGIVFGLYPANRASKLDPIEALRHE
ncbi:MAG: ABC transporter permease [Deltaproteobacteria bacterium]